MAKWAWSAGEADGGEVGQVGDWSSGPPGICVEWAGCHESERGSEWAQMTDSRGRSRWAGPLSGLSSAPLHFSLNQAEDRPLREGAYLLRRQGEGEGVFLSSEF